VVFVEQRQGNVRHTMYDMKSSAVTIRLDPPLQKLLDRVCEQSGRTRSDILREALKRQLSIERFEQLRRQILPFAEARGYLTDEDVDKVVS
jgi:predicted transcriptional regulator